MPRLRALIVAFGLDGEDVGETYSAFQWVKALAEEADLTVLATQRHSSTPLGRQLPEAEVVTWPEPRVLYERFERFNAMAQPWLPVFNRKVARWIRAAQAAGRRFDVAHQILPQAPRHATPLRHFRIPYVLGPLGGGLDTPPGFAAEVGRESRIVRLRELDGWRLRHDPALRRGLERAGLILGVAPYIQQRLHAAGLGHLPFRPVLERAHGPMPALPERQRVAGQLRLLHVGRVVRTKALRDTVRAMALLRDMPGVTLTSAGDGPDLAACRAEADALGLGDRVRFLGRVPRAEVDRLYAGSDVFCFPSFREPMGGVFFEAMEWGLPVIAAARGGPDFIVDDTSGIRLPVETPEQFARDIAEAIRRLANDPALRLSLGQGARRRLESFGTWQDKALETVALWRGLLGPQSGATA
ncbi:MAG: glycosyltransferase family 4 protein [Gemmobacter sp.]